MVRTAQLSNAVSEQVIGAAIEVHRYVGPGLLESTYQSCLAIELGARGLRFDQERPVGIVYKGESVPFAYRVDFIVESVLVVELKAVERINSVHEAQLRTYLRHLGIASGLLLNFHAPLLRLGIRRLALDPEKMSEPPVSHHLPASLLPLSPPLPPLAPE